jgi:YegS/Rv2252/BmrU family lipid kinase
VNPLLVVNPNAGGGKTGRVFGEMRAPIERALGPVDVVLTERPRHASEATREAALAGRETVIAVGGDGTIHEVVSGIMDARELGATATRMGIVPQGTGGDFRKTLFAEGASSNEHRLDRYCERIAAGRTRRIDVGRLTHGVAGEPSGTDRAWFINILSIGVGGLVDRYVAETPKLLGGKAAYFVASARGLLASEIGVLRCRIHDGDSVREEEIRSRSMAICNGRFFGGGMQVAPAARLDDGRFHVVDLGGGSRLSFAALSSSIYSGKHLEHPSVRCFPATRIEVELLNRDAAERFLLDVDGEPFGRMPIDAAVVPGALEVFA